MSRKAKLMVIPILAMQVLIFGFIARYRFIDGDEGAFLLASRLVLMHKIPYLDFFYNQAPLLPYAYAGWMSVAGISWNAGRALCVLLTAVLGLLLYLNICEETQSVAAGVIGILLFASSTMIFAWFTVVKTHCLSGLLLFAAYFVMSKTPTSSSPWRAAFGGLFFGLSIETRSYLILVLPLLLWWLIRNVEKSTQPRASVALLAGVGIGTLPSLYLFLSSPNTFLFDNLGYHGLRSTAGLIGWWQEKLVVFAQLFLGSREGNGLQWSILFLISFALVLAVSSRAYRPKFAFQIAVLLMIIGLLPTPSYAQYFCLCVPFLIVSAVCGATDLVTHLESKRDRVIAGTACFCVVAVYMAASAGDFRRYLVTGEGVPGVQPALDRGDWKVARVTEVSQALGQITIPGETVAAFWPGDIFQTSASPVSGLENPFALPVSDKLTPEQRARYHIVTADEIRSSFAEKKPRVVVLRNQILSAVTADELRRMQVVAATFRDSLRANGYVPVRSIGGISIYVCCGGGHAAPVQPHD